MKLEDQVCSLSQGKLVQSIIGKKESLFSWWQDSIEEHKNHSDGSYVAQLSRYPDDKKISPAFTVAELIDNLPCSCRFEIYKINYKSFSLKIHNINKQYTGTLVDVFVQALIDCCRSHKEE